jgi:osmotically-inducible protein OsmY
VAVIAILNLLQESSMQRPIQLASVLFAGLLTVGAVNSQSVGVDAKHPAADNTAVNAVDREKDTVTPIDQSNDKEALEITAAIRRAVINDKSLSTSAHNVKIVTNGHTVTIRGPVASEAEKERIQSLAVKSAPGKQVRNELSIAG